MTAPRVADDPAPARKTISTGTLLILALGLVILVGWFVYRPYIPPAWLHSFASDIALRATVDPTSPPPEDLRQATPRGLASSPYICAARAIAVPWDRLVIVGAGQDPRARDILKNAAWGDPSLEKIAETMGRDVRYQFIVLIKDNTVVDAQMFYTFWADLSGIARSEGFTPAEAIFTAASKDRVYVLSPVSDAPSGACP